MKKLLFILIIVFLLLIPSVLSISISSYESKPTVIAEANFEKTFSYIIRNNLAQTIDVDLSLEGDMAKYASLDKEYVEDVGPRGSFPLKVTLKLPRNIDEKPGIHTIYVGALEERNPDGVEGVGARGSIRTRIFIRVRYPGEYIEASLTANDVQVGKQADLKVTVSNFGSETITNAYAAIDIYDSEDNKLTTVYTTGETLEIDKTYKLDAKLNTAGYKRGEYKAVANVFYSGKNITTNEDYFRVGDININIINNSKTAYANLINPFDITITSEWNNIIRDIHAKVDIISENVVVSSFETLHYDLRAWETKEITGYWNTAGLVLGTYTTNVTIFYAGKEDTKTGFIELIKQPVEEEPFFAETVNILLVSIVILLVIVNIFWFIYFQRKSKEKR